MCNIHVGKKGVYPACYLRTKRLDRVVGYPSSFIQFDQLCKRGIVPIGWKEDRLVGKTKDRLRLIRKHYKKIIFYTKIYNGNYALSTDYGFYTGDAYFATLNDADSIFPTAKVFPGQAGQE